jgi:hypothetical protein
MLTVTHIAPNGNETIYPAVKVVRDYIGMPGQKPGVLVYDTADTCWHLEDGEVYVKHGGRVTNHYALTHFERAPLNAAA